jgi:hypothetical protein
MHRSWRGINLLVPALAILLAAIPAWIGDSLNLPDLWDDDTELVVLNEQPTPIATIAMPAEDPTEFRMPPLIPADQADRATAAPIRRPSQAMLAVVGVGLQGLVIRSQPGDGEKLSVASEGADLRNLGATADAHGREWTRVRTPEGIEGWVASDFLLPWDGTDREARTVAMLGHSAGVEPTSGRDRSWLDVPEDVRSITPDQLKDGQTLSRWEAFAACAPAATVAFARATGHNLNLDEAVVAARKVGWNADQGIPGPRAQVALLASIGVDAYQRGESEDTVDWDRVIGDVQAGLPVIVVTINHYFVAERYDPATGMLDFGNSATVLAGSGGRRWFAPEEIGWIGYGAPFATIHLGRAPSTVAQFRSLDY